MTQHNPPVTAVAPRSLKTGVCELIDNAIDFWTTNDRTPPLHIDVTLDADRQFIEVRDDAGGVLESQVEMLIAPGASRDDPKHALIGIFGVGGKRAGVALGELVEIRTRHQNGKTIEVDLTKEWIESPSWDLDIYEIPAIPPRTTVVTITKIRRSFNADDVEALRRHLGETYSWFLGKGCQLKLNGQEIMPIVFDKWAYPRDFLPRQAKFQVEPAEGQFLDVTLTGGLIRDRDPELENYGVYFYCNRRLIIREVRVRRADSHPVQSHR